MDRIHTVSTRHGIRAVDDDHHGSRTSRSVAAEPAPGNHRPGDGEHDQRDQPDPKQQQQQLFQLQPPPCLARRVQKLHGSPFDDIEPAPAEQMCHDRKGDAKQAQQQPGIQEELKHLSPTRINAPHKSGTAR